MNVFAALQMTVTSLALNWRGAMSAHSAADMRQLGLSLSDLEVVSSMVYIHVIHRQILF